MEVFLISVGACGGNENYSTPHDLARIIAVTGSWRGSVEHTTRKGEADIHKQAEQDEDKWNPLFKIGPDVCIRDTFKFANKLI